ncbi:MAG: methyltransferase domain-containing protein [Desulfobacterales bacterium]|nr:methyltransferase domain-containing protein [Desulfobacterales bacterium]MDP6806686.1 methyltransferase domain-containing protein [Desulfobacterales bacterium]
MKKIPNTMVELGPGGSFGIGIAAMLSGVNNYYALDVVPVSRTENNLEMLKELAELLKKCDPRPRKGWPDFDLYLNDSLFPDDILQPDLLAATLTEERIDLILSAIKDSGAGTGSIRMEYIVPWQDKGSLENESADLILSHSVMEHVEDIDKAYSAMYEWLKPGGFISHQIDFRSHGTAYEWNGYWTYSDIMWRIMNGKLPYLINRQSCSAHIDVLLKRGFEIVYLKKRYENHGIKRAELDSRWHAISDDDLKCSGLFIQAKKR